MKPSEKMLAREAAIRWWQTLGKNRDSGYCDACVARQTEIPRGQGYLVKGASSMSFSGSSMDELLRRARDAQQEWRAPDLVCEQCADANDYEAWKGPFEKPSRWRFWRK
jgi:hypothetical protein